MPKLQSELRLRMNAYEALEIVGSLADEIVSASDVDHAMPLMRTYHAMRAQMKVHDYRGALSLASFVGVFL